MICFLPHYVPNLHSTETSGVSYIKLTSVFLAIHSTICQLKANKCLILDHPSTLRGRTEGEHSSMEFFMNEYSLLPFPLLALI